MVLRFSMDRSDYGRMTWAILYGIISAALAFGLVRLVWHTIPWDWIGAIGLSLVHFYVVPTYFILINLLDPVDYPPTAANHLYLV